MPSQQFLLPSLLLSLVRNHRSLQVLQQVFPSPLPVDWLPPSFLKVFSYVLASVNLLNPIPQLPSVLPSPILRLRLSFLGSSLYLTYNNSVHYHLIISAS